MKRVFFSGSVILHSHTNELFVFSANLSLSVDPVPVVLNQNTYFFSFLAIFQKRMYTVNIFTIARQLN